MNESSYFELLNEEIDIELGPHDKPVKFKARKIGTCAVLAKAEAAIISKRIAQAREAAQGMMTEEKAKFLIEALDLLPEGQALQKAGLAYLSTVAGTSMAIKACLSGDNQPSLEDVTRLVWKTEPADIRALVHLLCDL